LKKNLPDRFGKKELGNYSQNSEVNACTFRLLMMIFGKKIVHVVNGNSFFKPDFACMYSTTQLASMFFFKLSGGLLDL
jgi:hypothetical protein